MWYDTCTRVMRLEALLSADGGTMDMLLNLRFLIAAGVVFLPLAVWAYLVLSTMQQDHEQG